MGIEERADDPRASAVPRRRAGGRAAPLTRLFRCCPQCGAPGLVRVASNQRACQRCAFRYYLNPIVAAVGLVRNRAGELLLARRARAPGKGRLAFPGGFIDFGETAEAALRRELREELGIDVRGLTYLTSAPNDYPYGGVLYRVLDLYFVAEFGGGGIRHADHEVTSACFVAPDRIKPKDLAFASMRAALQCYWNSEGRRGLRRE